MNLFRPKQIIDDLYRLATPDLGERDREGRNASEEVDDLLHWWWGLWTIAMILNVAAGQGGEVTDGTSG